MQSFIGRQGWAAFLVVCIVLAVGVLSSQWLIERERQAINNYLSHELEVAQTRLDNAFDRYTGLMLSVRGWLYTHHRDSWHDAENFSTSLELKRLYPALSGLVFVRRVQSAKICSSFVHSLHFSLKNFSGTMSCNHS